MSTFTTYRARPIDLVSDLVKKRAAVKEIRRFRIHSTLPHPTQSSPAAETAVITYFYKFIHQTTPPFITALVTNLIYYSSSLNNVVVNYS